MSVLDDKAFHIVLISKGNIDNKKILGRMFNYSKSGFKKFVIHILTNEEKPLYLEKIRNLVFENIAFTLIISHHKPSRRGLDKLLNELRSKPYEIVEA